MGCDCPSGETCGCHFDAEGDITASGTGSSDNPLRIAMAPGRLPTLTLDSGDLPADAAIGQMVFEQDTGRVRVWNGTRWRLVSPSAAYDVLTGSAGTVTPLGGPLYVMNSTFPEPFGPGDFYLAWVSGTVALHGGTPGDTFQVNLELGPSPTSVGLGVITIGASGDGSCTIPGHPWNASGVLDVKQFVTPLHATTNAVTHASDSRENGVQALFFAE